ncbi:MAG TPA: winged helix DNA-binding domain-containing protein [Enteractinococcus sp.]
MNNDDAPATIRSVTNEERRARLAIRHALAPSTHVRSPEEAAHAVVSLHATEASSVHISCWARTKDLDIHGVEHALYESRSLVKQQAMRETLFVFPRELLPAVWSSVSARFARINRTRLIKDVERWGYVPEGTGPTWLDTAEAAVLEHLSDGVPRSATQLRQQVPEVAGHFIQSPQKSWGGKVAIAPKVLTGLSLSGKVTRAQNAGAWYTSRPTWTTTNRWWNNQLPPTLEAREGYQELINRWLWSYGPGTVEDITWWLGATKTIVRTALEDLGALPVALDDGSIGWLRHDDLDVITAPESWIALLPILDPTVMGWKHRDFFLGTNAPKLFDSVGNAGTTVWINGQVVGAWNQDQTGKVHLKLLEQLTPTASEALEAKAQQLTEWLAGQRVFTVNPSEAMKF